VLTRFRGAWRGGAVTLLRRDTQELVKTRYEAAERIEMR